jgi:hypothetical protein
MTTSGVRIGRKNSRGAVLIILMTILAMGMLYFVVRQLEAVSTYQRELQIQTNAGGDVLAQAREALLGYAVTYRDDPTHAAETFGYLPCPDLVGDGRAGDTGGACGTAGQASVGLLPYKALGLPDLHDATGICLWYAVSGSFKSNPKGSQAATPIYLNWDTQGQFKVIDAKSTTLVAPDTESGGAAAVIFATGPALSGQNRTSGSTAPCNIDPSQISAFLDGKFDTATGSTSAYNFATTATITLSQGPAQDSSGATKVNDRLGWITPREIFDRVMKRKDFSNSATGTPPGHLNTLNNEIKAVLEKWMQDDLVAGGTPSTSLPANGANYAITTIGEVSSGAGLSTTGFNQTYRSYFDNWLSQHRQRVCPDLKTACLAINNGTTANCRGALVFAGRGATGLRTTAQQASGSATLSNYYESALGLLNNTLTTFTGNAAYTDTGTDSSRAADVATCLFPGNFLSFAQDIASFATGTTTSGTSIATVDTTAKTVTLGDTGGTAGTGCVWYPTAVTFGSSLRLYYRFQFITKGNGFALTLADGATNQPPVAAVPPRSQIMCGSADNDSIGYAGPPPGASAPGIEKPKLGIEFDTFYSSARNDPPGNHMALLYWGTATDTDGSDDNKHYAGNGGVTVTNATWASNKATLTTASAHGFAVGQVVLVSGLSPSGYNGTVTVTDQTTTTLKYAVSSDPGAFVSKGQAKAASTGSAPRNPRVATATAPSSTTVNVLASANTASGSPRYTSYDSTTQRVTIVTDAPHGLSAGDVVVVSGITPAAYNGTFTVSSVPSTLPYRFRYYKSSDPGAYVSDGTVAKLKSSELSALTWAGNTVTATSPTSHGFSNGENVTTFGMTPSGFGATANLVYGTTTQFTYPLTTDPAGSFATESPAGMAMIKTSDTHLPYSSFPSSTNIYVRLDITRSYDATNRIAVLDVKTYVMDRVTVADACTLSDLKNLARDMSVICPNLSPTLQQDSIPISNLSTVSSASWTAGTVTVTTATPHGLLTGANASISSISPSAYNGSFTVTRTSATKFTYSLTTDPTAYSSGGEVQPAVQPLSSLYVGFTNARGAANTGENQNVTIYDFLMRSQ